MPATGLGPVQTAFGFDPILHKEDQELVLRHLGKSIEKLFAEFTGLHFHCAWAPTAHHIWPMDTLLSGCSVCSKLGGAPLLSDCHLCGPRRLARALSKDGDGHIFTCRLGVRNYWCPIRVRGDVLGIAHLQALAHTLPGPSPGRAARTAVIVVSAAEFSRASRFLQLIVRHAQTSALVDLGKADLASSSHTVVALEKEQARLHETLERRIPSTPQALSRPAPESHSDQVVRRLMECIQKDFGQPITLKQCAKKLGMNVAYASTLFSQTVGVPFKTYLTELRMEKAKALLSDPAKTASEVAFCTGYASENRFRLAFKKATGLPPTTWRETMHCSPPSPAPTPSSHGLLARI
jgi:AraC-like DNA-binding protein